MIDILWIAVYVALVVGVIGGGLLLAWLGNEWSDRRLYKHLAERQQQSHIADRPARIARLEQWHTDWQEQHRNLERNKQ